MDANDQELKVINNKQANQFEVDLGEATGFIAYSMQADNVYVMSHTEVPPQFQGEGIGDKLVGDALEMVKAEGKQVVPRCSFVHSFIQRHPEYKDLVAKDAA